MSILIHRHSRFLIQGITGNMGRFSLRDMVAYGTQVVAGVSASFDQPQLDGVPVFRNIAQARAETDANVSIIYAPAIIAKQQVLEAFDAGIQFVIYPGDGLPAARACRDRPSSATR